MNDNDDFPFDPAFEEMVEAHTAEAAKRGAKFYNLGWGTTDDGIASKTSRGILSTERRGPGQYEHSWG